MTPQSPPDGEFARMIEPLLFALGGAMTLGLLIFLGWLLRTMIREDRQAAAERDQHHDEGAA